MKRAQEAVRVLEEFLRGEDPELARRLALIRFGLYEAEQWVECGSESARRLRRTRVYVLLTAALCRRDWLETARLVLAGGAGTVQLREKELEGAELVERAKRLRDLCEQHGALCIVNDRVDAALAADAGGVHVGQGDLAPAEVRRIAGRRLLVGRSTHSVAQARLALAEEAVDYIAVGAMYPTETKPGHRLMGPGLACSVADLKPDAPVFAIGGITVERARELRGVGVERIAVSGAALAAPDPERAVRELLDVMELEPVVQP